MIYRPVYQDTYYTTTASSLSYYIMYSGQRIFSGRAVRMPSQDSIRININKLCQPYLRQSLTSFFTGGTTDTGTTAIGTFSLYNSNNVKLEDYTFLHCYDYDFKWTGTTGVTISQPICDVYGEGMKTLTTRINSSRNVVTTAAVPSNTDCHIRYALIYVNARGGWDVFAIQGTGVKKDSITQYLTDKSFDNNTREFETNRYLSEIKTSWTLNTHYLSDEQSRNLAKNLISSNMVYLQDLEEGTIVPVVITDTSATYQTYQTNGKKMAQYKINVQSSQSKLRR